MNTTKLKQFDIKNIQYGHGHDGGGLICDVYLGKLKVGRYDEDGWAGAGTGEISFISKETKEKFNSSFEIEKGKTIYQQHISIVYSLFENKLDEKEKKDKEKKSQRKLNKTLSHAITWGTKDNYQFIGWKSIKKLEDMLRFSNGQEKLTNAYNNALSQILPGEKILNTKEQLKQLGLIA